MILRVKRKLASPRKRTSGFIFIVALVVIAGLIALLAMLVADQKAGVQAIQTGLRQRRAEAAAEAGVARAMAVLDTANANTVTLNDAWAQQGSNGDEAYDLNGALTRMQIVDAASLININTASSSSLQLLPLDQDQIDSLLDWRETGTTARADGAKDAYYNALPQPYNTRLGPLDTVDELLLVRNWTAQALYQSPSTTTGTVAAPTSASGSVTMPTDINGNILPLASLFTVDSGSPNTRSTGTARINFSTRGLNTAALGRLGITGPLANRIAQGAPYTSFTTLFAVRGMNPTTEQILLNAASFSTSTRLVGKVNLNTATQAVLQSVPTISQAVATTIVGRQSTGFQTLGELATLAGVPPNQVGPIADAVSIGSDTWIVRSYGESGGVGVAVEVVVRLTSGTMHVVTWSKINTTTLPGWWNWQAQPTTTVDAGVTQ